MNSRSLRERSEGSMTDGRKQDHKQIPETLLELMQRDLEAWIAAKAAIAKAMEG